MDGGFQRVELAILQDRYPNLSLIIKGIPFAISAIYKPSIHQMLWGNNKAMI